MARNPSPKSTHYELHTTTDCRQTAKKTRAYTMTVSEYDLGREMQQDTLKRKLSYIVNLLLAQVAESLYSKILRLGQRRRPTKLRHGGVREHIDGQKMVAPPAALLATAIG